MTTPTDRSREAFEKWYSGETYPDDAQQYFMLEAWNAARADMVEELCKQLEECTGFITCREDAIALIRAVAGGKDD